MSQNNRFDFPDGRRLIAGDTYLTTREIEQRYRISPPTQCRWRREGGGPPFVKLKGTILYPLSLFDAWLQSKLVGSTAEHDRLEGNCTDRYKHLPAARAKADAARAALKKASMLNDASIATTEVAADAQR